MKKSILRISMALFFLAIFCNCQVSANTVDGNGTIVTRSIEVTAFDEVAMSLPAKVNYTVSDEYTCSVRLDENLFDYLDIRVEDQKLRMGKSKNNMNVSLNPTEFVIDISAPTLEEVKIAGSGDFYVLTPLQVNEFDVSLAGSGSVFFTKSADINSFELSIAGSGGCECQQLKSNKADINIAGSGDVKISAGSVIKMEISIAGSGSVESYCDTRDLKAHITGSGDITANVSNNLNYEVSGSGTINYYGNPILKGKGSKNALNQLEY